MKVLGIINKGFTHINTFKFAKMQDDAVADSVLRRGRASAERYNTIDNDRGSLRSADISLIEKVKEQIPEALGFVKSSKKDVLKKLFSYDRVIKGPKDVITLKINNPEYTAFSGSVKKYRGEEYFDFTMHGYFDHKRHFLINNDGEIIKSAPAKFFTSEPLTAMDREPVYYSQYEINNLGLNRYIDIFSKEIKKFRDFVLMPADQPKTPVVIPKPSFDRATFMFKQRDTLNDMHKNFDKLYYGILNNSRTTIQRRKLSDICDVAIHKKFALMQIENINSSKDYALVNFSQMGSKPVARIVVHSAGAKTNRLFIDGQLVEEWSRDGSNPFTVGRIAKYYSPLETSELGVEKLLEDINNKLLSSIKQLRSVLGSSRVDK